MTTPKPTTWAVALSGGGARGIIHIGVLQAFTDMGFRPAALSGTSMGAIVGAFYALGLEPLELLRLIKKKAEKKRIFHLSPFHRPDTGFFEMTLLDEYLRDYAPRDDFSVMRVPFFVSVSNLTTGKNEIISSGPFIDFVIASATIPVIFETKRINGHHYVDGGLTKNMAAAVLKSQADVVVGVHSNHIDPARKIDSIRDVAERCFQLAIFNTVRNEIKFCDYLIDPPKARNYSTFDFDKADEIYETGYEEGLRFLKKLQLI